MIKEILRSRSLGETLTSDMLISWKLKPQSWCVVMVKRYRVLTEGTAEKIEEDLNRASSEGWDVVEFGYGAMQTKFWALVVKKE